MICLFGQLILGQPQRIQQHPASGMTHWAKIRKKMLQSGTEINGVVVTKGASFGLILKTKFHKKYLHYFLIFSPL